MQCQRCSYQVQHSTLDFEYFSHLEKFIVVDDDDDVVVVGGERLAVAWCGCGA